MWRLMDKLSQFKPIVVVAIFSPWLLLAYLFVSGITDQLPEGDQQIVHDFIEWFGTAYSLFLALVLVNVWNQFDTIEREFDKELDAIAAIYQTANYTKALKQEGEGEVVNFKNNIKDHIEKYLNHVTHKYAIEHLVPQQRINGEKQLERIGDNISMLAHDQLVVEPLIAELFRNLNEARDTRGDRISHCRQKMPETVWLVSLVASIVWLLPFLALRIENRWISLVLIGGVAFVIVIVLIIIRDLNDPFEGTWKIDLEDWHAFTEILNPRFHVFFVYSSKNNIVDRVSRMSIGRLLSLNECKLSELAHDGFFQQKWKRFIREIKRTRGEGKTVKCDIMFYDDVAESGYEEYFKDLTFPCVILKHGERIHPLLGSQDINECPNLTELIKLFNDNILEYIDWY